MATFAIELSLRKFSDLFETAEPPPWGPKQLHPQIFDAIVEQWGHAPRGQAAKLVVHLPTRELTAEADLGNALRDYFVFYCAAARREIRRILRDGRAALFIGLVFLIVANAIAEVVHEAFAGRFASGVANGLEIFGWVALWHPAELLLYDWVPVYRRLRLLRRLSVAEIEILSP